MKPLTKIVKYEAPCGCGDGCNYCDWGYRKWILWRSWVPRWTRRTDWHEVSAGAAVLLAIGVVSTYIGWMVYALANIVGLT